MIRAWPLTSKIVRICRQIWGIWYYSYRHCHKSNIFDELLLESFGSHLLLGLAFVYKSHLNVDLSLLCLCVGACHQPAEHEHLFWICVYSLFILFAEKRNNWKVTRFRESQIFVYYLCFKYGKSAPKQNWQIQNRSVLLVAGGWENESQQTFSVHFNRKFKVIIDFPIAS